MTSVFEKLPDLKEKIESWVKTENPQDDVEEETCTDGFFHIYVPDGHLLTPDGEFVWINPFEKEYEEIGNFIYKVIDAR